LLAAITVAAYWRVHTLLFTAFDDPGYVTANVNVQSGLTWSNLRWASTAIVASNWHPITMLSHMLDCQLFGLEPAGHHLTSLAIHLANVLLLFWVLQLATGLLWRSGFVAALFAVHPLNVESVAWIAERKNVLSTLFFLLTVLAYIWYVRSPNWKRYVSVCVLFALGLMTKPMLVTLPFLLLLIDYWPLERWKTAPLGSGTDSEAGPDVQGLVRDNWLRRTRYLLTEKIPLFALSIMGCAVTLYTQKTYAIVPTEMITPVNRFLNAAISYALYLVKTIWPSKLAPFYPYTARPAWQALLATLLLLAVTALAALTARKWKFFVVGWLWYLGSLVPVIGIVQVGGQSRADRYAYIPLIGVFVLVVWAAAELAERTKAIRVPVITLGACALLTLATLTGIQTEYWHDSVTLFGRAEQVTGKNWMASLVLGVVDASQGRIDDAVSEYSKISPNQAGYGLMQMQLGLLLQQTGQLDDAIAHFKNAAEAMTNPYLACLCLGDTLGSIGRDDEAIQYYRKALELPPKGLELSHAAIKGHDVVEQSLGMIFVQKGQLGQAIAHFKRAIELNPGAADAYNKLGAALVDAGLTAEAGPYFARAAELEPDYPPLYANLGTFSEAKGDSGSALQYYNKALELIAAGKGGTANGTTSMAAELNLRLANLLSKEGRDDEAKGHYLEVLRLRPDDQAARQNLDRLSKHSSKT